LHRAARKLPGGFSGPRPEARAQDGTGKTRTTPGRLSSRALPVRLRDPCPGTARAIDAQPMEIPRGAPFLQASHALRGVAFWRRHGVQRQFVNAVPDRVEELRFFQPVQSRALRADRRFARPEVEHEPTCMLPVDEPVAVEQLIRERSACAPAVRGERPRCDSRKTRIDGRPTVGHRRVVASAGIWLRPRTCGSMTARSRS
jgi:hypothetical protein